MVHLRGDDDQRSGSRKARWGVFPPRLSGSKPLKAIVETVLRGGGGDLHGHAIAVHCTPSDKTLTVFDPLASGVPATPLHSGVPRINNSRVKDPCAALRP